MTVRPRHLARAQEDRQMGIVREGGAILSHPSSHKQAQMKGSMFILAVQDEQACRTWLDADPYMQEGVWDPNSIQIHPIRLAFHAPQGNKNELP